VLIVSLHVMKPFPHSHTSLTHELTELAFDVSGASKDGGNRQSAPRQMTRVNEQSPLSVLGQGERDLNVVSVSVKGSDHLPFNVVTDVNRLDIRSAALTEENLIGGDCELPASRV
jgi:hypothetical protein